MNSSDTTRSRMPRHKYIVRNFFLAMWFARSFFSAFEMSSVVAAKGAGLTWAWA